MRPWMACVGADSSGRCPQLQWGHGLAAVDGVPLATTVMLAVGFNGATALRPWMAAESFRTPQACLASMGPRPCGRGWLRPCPERIAERGGFNGATALRPWMDLRLGAPGDQAHQASMGPRPCGRGWPASAKQTFNFKPIDVAYIASIMFLPHIRSARRPLLCPPYNRAASAPRVDIPAGTARRPSRTHTTNDGLRPPAGSGIPIVSIRPSAKAEPGPPSDGPMSTTSMRSSP